MIGAIQVFIGFIQVLYRFHTGHVLRWRLMKLLVLHRVAKGRPCASLVAGLNRSGGPDHPHLVNPAVRRT